MTERASTRNGERGQSLILVAIALTALFAFMGLVLDGGDLYLARRDSQNASDAAAFAGARVITLDSGTEASALATINHFAMVNHVQDTATNVKATFIDPAYNPTDFANATGVTVVTTITVPAFFISLVSGINEYPASTVATVQTGRLAGSPVAPVTVACKEAEGDSQNPCGFQKGQPAILKGTNTSAGNLQWIAFLSTQPDGTCYGENLLAEYLADPPTATPPYVRKGDWVCGNTGSVNAADIKRDLKHWVDANKIRERPWIVPIYDCIGHDGICDPNTGMNVRYHIVAFGAFVLMGYDLNGKSGGNCNGPGPMRYDCTFNTHCPSLGCLASPPAPPGQQYPCQYWDQTANKGLGDWVWPNSCVLGRFVSYTEMGPIEPGACNNTGLDICGIEMKQ